MKPTAEQDIGINAAAEIVGVTPRRLAQLDDLLRPRRVGVQRCYSKRAIEAYAAARDAERAERARSGRGR